jgi:YfiH family protein
MHNIIVPDWPVPPHIKAFTTLRRDGVSKAPFASWNLAQHVDDKQEHVDMNRALLHKRLALPEEPFWLEQVHGTRILTVDGATISDRQADGSYTRASGRICVVMTADCLPLLLCNRTGTEVAAVHAGWRGLADGVIEAALRRFQSPPEDLLAWLGPAIGPKVFQVGEEVRETFLHKTENASDAFTAQGNHKYLANIYELARQRLQLCGVHAVFGGEHCTFTEASLFYSYRRERVTGRMASLIWIE